MFMYREVRIMEIKQINYLKAIREQKGKTQPEVISHLEKKLGRTFSQPFFSMVENNVRLIPIDWLEPLSEFLGCSIDDILKGE